MAKKKASAKKKATRKKVAKPKVAKKAEPPLDPTRLSVVQVAPEFAGALKEAGYLYADEVVGTNADVLEGKVKGWDRATASRAKAACFEALNPQGAPPPGSYK